MAPGDWGGREGGLYAAGGCNGKELEQPVPSRQKSNTDGSFDAGEQLCEVAVVFIDDYLVFSKSAGEHMQHVHIVLPEVPSRTNKKGQAWLVDLLA